MWKSRAPAQPKFDIYGYDLPEQDVREKISDSIWDTFDASQAAAKIGRQAKQSHK